MFWRFRKHLIFLGLVLLSLSCTRLPQDTGTRVAVELLPDGVSIPAAWGDLVGVSNHPQLVQITQLWLQNEEGTIRIVWYNARTFQLALEARVIRRP